MLLEERAAAPARADEADAPAPRRFEHPLVWALTACVVLAALSLLAPSAPTYDPWSWIIWGREITQLDLSTTDGPSWKPLPVAFTTVFAVFGDTAPDLWLIVARAGALAGVLAAFGAARRLGGGITGGVAAAAALALAPWYLRNAALGNSEPLLVALLLGALERHLAGDRRAAFWLGVGCALLRPEAWPFLALYSLWLMRERVMPVGLVLGTGAATFAAWTLPEGWGSGDLLRAAHRAQEPNANAATFADDPVMAVLRDAGEMLTIPVIGGLALASILLLVRRDRALLAAVGVAVAWLGLVTYMTAGGGFSGNQRYLIPPVALAIVVAGAGVGWATSRVPRAGLVVAVVGGLFLIPGLDRLDDVGRAIKYQAVLGDQLHGVIEEAGGAERLKRCGTPYTGAFLVPAVAWELGLHTSQVKLEPRLPAVVFRVKTTSRHRASPTIRSVPTAVPLAQTDRWRIMAACG